MTIYDLCTSWNNDMIDLRLVEAAAEVGDG